MKPKKNPAEIARNKKAFHDYFIDERFEAGLSLMGWEVKSLRAGRVSLQESYVLIKDGQAWLFGCHMMPLASASTHVVTDPIRSRRLLLHRQQLDRLIGAVERKGYTLVPLSLYWKNGLAKVSIALARGKKAFDKRATIKEREWQIDKQRVMRIKSKS